MSASKKSQSKSATQKTKSGKQERLVPDPSQKASKWYPAEDQKHPKKVRGSLGQPSSIAPQRCREHMWLVCLLYHLHDPGLVQQRRHDVAGTNILSYRFGNLFDPQNCDPLFNLALSSSFLPVDFAASELFCSST